MEPTTMTNQPASETRTRKTEITDGAKRMMVVSGRASEELAG